MNSTFSPEISPEMYLPDLLRLYPETRSVFDRYGLKGCGGPLGPMETIHFFARTHGVDEAALLSEITQAMCSGQAIQPAQASIADTIYRPFFVAGIAIVLTAGASWGAYLLWQIGVSGSFKAASLQAINSHGHAQIYGWVGLFIMGFSLQAFPRIWHTELRQPLIAIAALGLMMLGMLVRTIGVAVESPPIALLGGLIEIYAVLHYTVLLVLTYLGSEARKTWRSQPYIAFIFAAIAYLGASLAMGVWHTWNTMTTAGAEQLWYVATFQAPLRDIQIHGMALCMILAVSIRMLPALFGLPEIGSRRGWLAFWLVNASVAAEVALFILYRWSENLVYAELLLLPWLGLIAGALTVILPWKLWKPFEIDDRSSKFIRASYAWLVVSLFMLPLMPVYQSLNGMKFSHAYYGATRHAITVGFISLMIMGFAAKVIPTLKGLDVRTLNRLWIPFILVNTGCLMRVSLQIMTDWNAEVYKLIGISGLLEVSGLAIWGAQMVHIMLCSKAPQASPALNRPASVSANDAVGQVLEWFPETLRIFDKHGFSLLNNAMLRKTLARRVSLREACAMKGVAIDILLADLNTTIEKRPDAT